MNVEDRIDRLERENRRLKLGGGGLAAAVLIVVLAGAATTQQPDTIEVKGLILKNDEGKKVAELNSDDRGTGIVFYDSEGEPRAKLGVLANGTGGIDVGSPASHCGLLPGGLAVVKDSKVVVVAGASPLGTGIRVDDGNGQMTIWSGGVLINDKDGKNRVSIGMKSGDDGNPGITISDVDGAGRKL